MDERLQGMRDSLQDALDELSSIRTSSESKSRALSKIERHLAHACVPKEPTEALDYFNALQYTFECNVPLRLLTWISASTSTLEALTNKGSMDHERESQASSLASQLSLSLSLIQGVALNHSASKTYLGRKYALEVLIDLLLASRHLSVTGSPSKGSPNSGSSRAAASGHPPLSSTVLDTLLCILVDSSAALRAFEDSNGVQAIVKILKRAGTPREVRMKCLEFLYFYLLDEPPTSSDGVKLSSAVPTPPHTAPATPARPLKPFLSSKPLRPSSSWAGSSEFTFPSSAPSSSTPPVTLRSTSGSSTNSFSSTSSNASGSTAPSSLASSPDKPSSIPPPTTPPNSPPLAHKLPQQLQPRSLMMLRREFDYEPQSPKKAQVSRLGVGGSRHTPGKSISRSRLGSGSEDDCQRYSQVPTTPSSRNQNGRTGDDGPPSSNSHAERVKTTEEKKELLGTILGNVDALVEGVRKAGIWGLG